MFIVSKSYFQFSNYISLDNLKPIDVRILMITTFILGYLTRMFFEPSKKATDTEKKVSIKKRKVSVSESVKSVEEHLSSTQNKKESVSKKSQEPVNPMPLLDIPIRFPQTGLDTSFNFSGTLDSPLPRSAPPAPMIRNLITICYKNVLPSQGVVTSPFMKSFAEQLKEKLKGYNVKFRHLDQASSSPGMDMNRVYLFFSNVKMNIQCSELNEELNTEGEEKNLYRDYSVVVLTKDNLSKPISDEKKIKLTENTIDTVEEIVRGDKKTPHISPSNNISVAENIANLVMAKFK